MFTLVVTSPAPVAYPKVQTGTVGSICGFIQYQLESTSPYPPLIQPGTASYPLLWKHTKSPSQVSLLRQSP